MNPACNHIVANFWLKIWLWNINSMLFCNNEYYRSILFSIVYKCTKFYIRIWWLKIAYVDLILNFNIHQGHCCSVLVLINWDHCNFIHYTVNTTKNTKMNSENIGLHFVPGLYLFMLLRFTKCLRGRIPLREKKQSKKNNIG